MQQLCGFCCSSDGRVNIMKLVINQLLWLLVPGSTQNDPLGVNFVSWVFFVAQTELHVITALHFEISYAA